MEISRRRIGQALFLVAALRSPPVLAEGWANPVPGSAASRPFPTERAERTGESDRTHSIEAGFDFFNYHYVESVDPPKKSTETGNIPALYAIYKKDWVPKRSYFDLYADLALGSTLYDGTTQAGVPLTKNTPETFFDLGGDYGMTFWAWGPASRLRAYAGLQLRFWARGDGQSGPGDYREQYSWLEIPLGVRWEAEIARRFSIALDFSARPQVAGQIKIYLSDLDPSNPDLSLNLGATLGYRLQLPVTFMLNDGFGLVATPWWELSTIGRSDSAYLNGTGGQIYEIHEPDSVTHMYGVRMAGVFRF